MRNRSVMEHLNEFNPGKAWLGAAALFVATFFVAGCGSSSSGSSPPPPPNQAPSASAGPDQSVDEGVVVNLTGAGTDNDGSIASYAWTQDSGTAVTITGADTQNASLTAPAVSAARSQSSLRD